MVKEIYNLNNYGKIKLDLMRILNAKNIKRNALATFAQVSPNMVNRYCNNEVTRVDLDILARFCDILDCDISDILIYERDKE